MVFYAAVSLISASTLLFEVALVRTFSIVLWHHFAFMIVTMALLGYGASGSLLMVFGRLRDERMLALFPLLFAAAAPLCYFTASRIPFEPHALAWDPAQLARLALYYLVLSLPFVFSGGAVALAFTLRGREAGRIYGADMAGAATGPLAAVAAFRLFDCGGVVLAASTGGLLSSLLMSLALAAPRRRTAAAAALAAAAAAAVLALRPSVLDPPLSPYKALSTALSFEGSEHLLRRWNAFSRVDLVKSPAVRYAPGLSLRYLGPLPDQLGITVDGDDMTAVTSLADPKRLAFFDYLPSALPYRLAALDGPLETKKVFLMDTGGGFAVAEALHHGVREIYGAETNGLVIEAADAAFGERIYDRARVSTGQARSVLKATARDYDIIAAGPGSVAPAAAALAALTEDYRFTVEALREYYGKLRAGGLLSITLYMLPPPRAEARLLNTVIEAAGDGETPIEERLMVFRTIETLTVVVKKGRFDERETAALRSFLDEMRYDAVHYPGMDPGEANRYNRFPAPLYRDLAASLLDDGRRAEFTERYLFDISPATDERPFFGHFFRLSRLGEVVRSVGGRWQILLEGGYLVPVVFVQAAALSLALVAAPRLLAATARVEAALASLPAALAYFFLIGTAYMFVEIWLIKKLILFLVHPEYAFSVVVSALLAGSGAGSLLSQRIGLAAGAGRAAAVVAAVAVAVSAAALGLPPLLDALLGLPLAARVMAAALVIAPPGVLMGMALPLGMRLLARGAEGLIPWAWAANAAASVMAGPAAVMAARAAGFTAAALAAALMYLAAAAIMGRRGAFGKERETDAP
ncbi:MAG TPA: hypothetical protein ENJ37_01505 [Deltaproteobacteria bacterium]|nr:hypothetical protein [Deltaproteobacteria bacterium]